MTSWRLDRALVPTGTRFDDALGLPTCASKSPWMRATVPGADQGAFPRVRAVRDSIP